MNVDNGVNVPTAQRLRAAFDALTEYTRPATQLAPLIAELGEALEARIAAINSTNASVVGGIENTLRGELVGLRAQLTTLESIAAQARTAQDALNTKLHTVSNHIMAFENKLDELSEALTTYIEDPIVSDAVTININTHSVDVTHDDK